MSTVPCYLVGVDVGGTKIAAGVVRFPDGVVLNRRVIPTRATRSGEEILLDVEELIGELISGFDPIKGIGLGICEIVDTTGQIASECSIRWQSLKVRELLGRIAPTIIEADVRAAALAESLLGAGQKSDIFLYVTIGTGISSCLFVKGSPFRGARGATGTMASGPLPVMSAENERSQVTLEQIASGPALVERFCAAGGRAETGQEVFAAALAGNAAASAILKSAGASLGGAIGWMVNILDPELVVVGGGVGLQTGLFRESLIDSIHQHCWWPEHKSIQVVAAATGVDAGLIGAAAAAWVRAEKP